MPNKNVQGRRIDFEIFEGPYKVKVCSRCKRRVSPEVDHNLGTSRWVYCDHGRRGLGTLESVNWETIEVVPRGVVNV